MASNNQGGNKSGNDQKSSGNQGNQGGSQSGNRQSADTKGRGFASMDPVRQRQIASEGGRAAHASGNAHEFTSEEARRAGAMSHKNSGNRQSAAAGSGSGNAGNQSGSSGGSSGNASGGSGSRSK